VRIALLAVGSRGDAQPMVVLGDELRRRGHDTVLGLSPNLIVLGERAGLTTCGLGPDSRLILESPEGQMWLAAGNARAFLKEMGAVMAAFDSQLNTEVLDICRGVDLVIAGVLVEDKAQCVTEALRVPLACVHLAPYRSNRAYPHPLVSTRRLPPLLNLTTHAAFGRLWWQSQRARVEKLRRQLELPADSTPTPTRMAATGTWELQAYSRVLTPALKDYPSRRPILGSFDLDLDLRVRLGEEDPGAELEAWLSAGAPPVYFGFGSMPVTDPPAMLDTIRGITEQLGVRALVGAGWSRLGADVSDDRVRVVDQVLNFDRVFPRCRMVVHHGGSGTVASSVAAGIPTLVCSVFADNGFWGTRVQDLGVGAHLPFSRITPQTLASKMRQTLLDPVVARSQEVGRALSADKGGAARAADLIERAFAG